MHRRRGGGIKASVPNAKPRQISLASVEELAEIVRKAVAEGPWPLDRDPVDARVEGYQRALHAGGGLGCYLPPLLERARLGGKDDSEALRQIAAWHLERGERLPGLLSRWAADDLRDRHRPLKDGRPSEHNRDHQIVLWVEYLGALGRRSRPRMHRTRNAESPPHSACDVVAMAFGRSYGTVKSIWNRGRRQRPELTGDRAIRMVRVFYYRQEW